MAPVWMPIDRPHWMRRFGDHSACGAVSLRHVLRDRGMGTALVGAHVGRDALASEEHFDAARREARPHAVADERVRDAVIVAINIDVVIERDRTFLPLGKHVRRRRQSSHGRPVERLQRHCAASRAVVGTRAR